MRARHSPEWRFPTPMSTGTISFIPLRRCDAEAMLAWQYPPPYDFYNSRTGPTEAAVVELLASVGQYFAVLDGTGQMVGFRSYGKAAQIEGGDYREPAVDIGGGLRPDMMARGLGRRVAVAAINFAIRELGARHLRSTLPMFNERARSICSSLGFRRWGSFTRPSDGVGFEIMTLAATPFSGPSPLGGGGGWGTSPGFKIP